MNSEGFHNMFLTRLGVDVLFVLGGGGACQVKYPPLCVGGAIDMEYVRVMLAPCICIFFQRALCPAWLWQVLFHRAGGVHSGRGLCFFAAVGLCMFSLFHLASHMFMFAVLLCAFVCMCLRFLPWLHAALLCRL